MLHTTGKSKAIVKNRKFPGGKENRLKYTTKLITKSNRK
jgi:hypothetical protein